MPELHTAPALSRWRHFSDGKGKNLVNYIIFFFFWGNVVLKIKMLEVIIYFCLSDLSFGLNKIFGLNLVKKLHNLFKRKINQNHEFGFL